MLTERNYCLRIIDMAYDYDFVGLCEILRDDHDMYASVAYITLLAHGDIPAAVKDEIDIAKVGANTNRAVTLLALTQDLQHDYLRSYGDTYQEIGESVETANKVLGS